MDVKIQSLTCLSVFGGWGGGGGLFWFSFVRGFVWFCFSDVGGGVFKGFWLLVCVFLLFFFFGGGLLLLLLLLFLLLFVLLSFSLYVFNAPIMFVSPRTLSRSRLCF